MIKARALTKGDKFISYVMHMIMKIGSNYDEFKQVTESYSRDRWF